MHRFSSRSGESGGLSALRHARGHPLAGRPPQAYCRVRSVSRFIDMMTFADGACEGRSRSKEKAMQEHRRRRATQRSPATPISPKGGGGTPSISLSLLLRDAHRHLVVVASRTRRRRARHKQHHIYETRHSGGRRWGYPLAGRTVRADHCADVVEEV